MLVVQLLLPRFLVVEVVLFIHFMHGQACKSLDPHMKLKDLITSDNSLQEQPKVNDNNEESHLCYVPVGNGTLDFEPLILDSESGRIIMPIRHNGATVIPIKGQAMISCPSARLPSIGDGSQNVIDVICSNVLHTKDDLSTIIQYKDLSCSRSIRESVQDEGLACGPPEHEGKIVQIGWKVSGAFLPQISVCHDKSLDHTYFTNHTIFGQHLEAKSSDSSRPSFKEGGGKFYSKSSADNAYKQTSQSAILSKMGLEGLDSYFAKGHLSPDADFVPKEWQDATYYFMNAAPQWQPFNNGNWKLVEAAVRKFALASKSNLKVQTGTFEGLQLKDGEPPLSLGRNNAIPVPLYLWKLVVNEEASKAIAFVTVNHPKLDDGDMSRNNICPDDPEDLCEAHGWQLPTRKKANKGLLYCCSYQSLKKAIPWIEKLGPNIGLLDIPS